VRSMRTKCYAFSGAICCKHSLSNAIRTRYRRYTRVRDMRSALHPEPIYAPVTGAFQHRLYLLQL